MDKIILKESDLKSLIERVMNENFNLSTEGKLEFLITRLKDLLNESKSESDGNLRYYMGRISNLIKTVDNSYQTENMNEGKGKNKFNKVMHEFGSGKLKTPNGKKVTDQKQAVAIGYSESGLDEETLNERIPVGNYDTWANLETGGAHGRGVQNRKTKTRSQNAKTETSSPLNSPNEYRQLLVQWGEGSDKMADQIFNDITKKFSIEQISSIANFGPVEDTKVGQMLLDFVNTKGYETGYYSDKNPSPQSRLKLTQQPK